MLHLMMRDEDEAHDNSMPVLKSYFNCNCLIHVGSMRPAQTSQFDTVISILLLKLLIIDTMKIEREPRREIMESHKTFTSLSPSQLARLQKASSLLRT